MLLRSLIGLTLLATLPPPPASAQAGLHPVLLSDSLVDDAPPGWHLSGQSPRLYQLHIDSIPGASSPALRCEPRPALGDADTWAAATQVILAAPYRGKRLMFTARCRYADVIHGGLWLRADGLLGTEPGILVADNMENRPFLGTAGWRDYRIVLDIPPNAEFILFGAHLQGRGRIWIAQPRLMINPPSWYPPTVKGAYTRRYEVAEYPRYYQLPDRALAEPILPGDSGRR